MSHIHMWSGHNKVAKLHMNIEALNVGYPTTLKLLDFTFVKSLDTWHLEV